MTALSWQVAIVLTIIGAFLLGFLFFSFKRAILIGLGVVLFWLVWTLGLSALFVGYSLRGPMAKFQLSLIIVLGVSGFALIYSFRRWQQRNKSLFEENQILRNAIYEIQANFDTPKFGENLKPSCVISGTKAHRKELLRQLRKANSRILILSGWVTHYGFDGTVRETLEKAIKRNAKVHIGWGYKLKASQNRSEFTDAERSLVEFAKKHRNSVYLAHFDNHSKLLVADSTCLIGSFNWLSNVSSKNDELSAIIEDNDFVDELWTSVSQELERYASESTL
jgi:hypothetical protein